MAGIIRKTSVVLLGASLFSVGQDAKHVTINPATGIRTLKLRSLRELKDSIDIWEKSNFERSQTFGEHFDAAKAAYLAAEKHMEANPSDYDAAQKSIEACRAELEWMSVNEKARVLFQQRRRHLVDRVQDTCEQLGLKLEDKAVKAVAAKLTATVETFDKGNILGALDGLKDSEELLDKEIAGAVKKILADVRQKIGSQSWQQAAEQLKRAAILAPEDKDVKSLGAEVRKQTVTTLKITAAMGKNVVPAVVHINGEWERLPYQADVKRGTALTVVAAYAQGAYTYGVGKQDIVCDWLGEKEITLALSAVQGPVSRKSWTVKLGDCGLELLYVRPGTFRMGRVHGEQSGESLHDVELRDGYWLGKTEVTQRQWNALMGKNPSFDTSSPDNPVENVSWDDAMLFCRKLTQQERLAGRLPEDYIYTLPTEAQWEFACRAGNAGDYAFGDDELVLSLYGNTVGTEDGYAKTAPVGKFRANGWGFLDMHGNVSEWCRDLYGTYPEVAVIDPAGPEDAESLHLHRGGSWNHDARAARAWMRDFATPSFHDESLGFRVALTKHSAK